MVVPEKKTWKSLLVRPGFDDSSLEASVSNILKEVKQNGDEAVKRFATMFDKVTIKNFLVTTEEINAAASLIDDKLKQAIEQAKSNIERFHQPQLQAEEPIETLPGIKCWRKSVAIEKVGLYIPGGSAPLFSTLLMLGFLLRSQVAKTLSYALRLTARANFIPRFYMQQNW